MDFKSVQYHRIDDHESGDTKELPITKSAWYIKVVILLLAFVGTITVGMLVGSLHPFDSFRGRTAPRITSCGRTSEEAIARGCVMEPMVYGWMPPHCHYQEVSQKNSPFEDWQWYADENMTTLLSTDQLWRGEILTIWNNVHNYHTQHCLFLYRKLAYGVENGVEWLDKKTTNWAHADHCVGQLSNGKEADDASTHVILGMYECERTAWA